MDCGFQGYVRQGAERVVIISASNPSTGAVEVPDAAPTYRVYGPSGIILTGTCGSAFDGSVEDASNDSPIEITSADHGLETGNIVTVAGVGGNTAANGTFQVTKTGDNTFTLNGTTGNGAYTTGGTWQTTAQHTVELGSADTALMTPGETYTVDLAWSVSSNLRTLSFCIGCN